MDINGNTKITKHYKLIVKKTELFKGRLDGYDISQIIHFLDDLTFDEEYTTYDNLLEELYDIQNAMLCEHGLDYGQIVNSWEDGILKILDEFENGYERNEENLNKLIELIEEQIK